ncbi:hypothetical protein ACFX1X_014753 [Malus domestica]
MEECAACYKQYNKKNIFSSTLRALSTWFISRDVDYVKSTSCSLAKAFCKTIFTEQGCLLCLKLFDSFTFQSEHKNTCCLSAPAPMVR